MKNLIIVGKQGTSEMAQSILDLQPSKYTCRLHHKITSVQLQNSPTLPYCRTVVFDAVPSELRLFELSRLLNLFAPDVTVIFTIKQPKLAFLPKEDLFNIITL